MKKLCSIYKSDMFRALLYKTVRRLAVAACLCLLWERFVSDGRFTIWEAPCFAVGAAPYDEAAFSPALAEQVRQGFAFLVPYYEFFARLCPDTEG